MGDAAARPKTLDVRRHIVLHGWLHRHTGPQLTRSNRREGSLRPREASLIGAGLILLVTCVVECWRADAGRHRAIAPALRGSNRTGSHARPENAGSVAIDGPRSPSVDDSVSHAHATGRAMVDSGESPADSQVLCKVESPTWTMGLPGEVHVDIRDLNGEFVDGAAVRHFETTEEGFWVSIPPWSATAVAYVSGYSPLHVEWGNGVCFVENGPRERVEVFGTVEGRVDRSWVSGCGSNVQVSPDGTFALLAVPWQCEIAVSRFDGAIHVQGSRALVNPHLGDVGPIALALPMEVKGGVGLGLTNSSAGVRISQVVQDAPAARAGLSVGMSVEAIGDTAAPSAEAGDEQMSEFRGLLSGPAGTEVSIRVSIDGYDTTVRLEREFIPQVYRVSPQ